MKHTAIGASLEWVDPRDVPHGYNFVRATWTEGTIGVKPWALSNGEYRQAHRRVVDRVLARCSLAGVVAKSSPLSLVGWIAFEAGVCHFFYVAAPLRRMGVGTELVKRVPGADVAVTHWTPWCLKFELPPHWRNDPLWFQEHVEVPNGDEEQRQSEQRTRAASGR